MGCKPLRAFYGAYESEYHVTLYYSVRFYIVLYCIMLCYVVLDCILHYIAKITVYYIMFLNILHRSIE